MGTESEKREEQSLPAGERLLTYQECAKLIDISVSTLRRKVNQLGIPKVVMGHQIVRFHYPTVLKYFHDRNRTR